MATKIEEFVDEHFDFGAEGDPELTLVGRDHLIRIITTVIEMTMDSSSMESRIAKLG